MLELVAVAGRTLDQAVLTCALDAPRQEDIARRVLAREHLVRVTGSTGTQRLECYHDRIREAVLAALDRPRLALRHGQIARALDASGLGDPEELLEHYRAAGESLRARVHAIRAAEAAADALAFARAARLYDVALSIAPCGAEERLSLLRTRGDCLVYAGSTFEAAAVFRSAAELASNEDAIDLLRSSAQHMLSTGQHEQGLPILKRVLRAVDLPYARSKTEVVARLLVDRIWLRTSRFEIRANQGARLSSRARLRADVCFSAAAALSMSDPLRSAGFSARHLRLVLASGDAQRIARGLAFELGVAPAAGSEGLRWAERALPIAERLAASDETTYSRALYELATGHVEYLAGRWPSAIENLERAQSSLRALPRADTQWALLSCDVLMSISRSLTGRIPQLQEQLPAASRDARERGDAYTLALLTFPRTMVALAQDDVESARRCAEELDQPASQPGHYQLRDFMQLHSQLLVSRYVGNHAAAQRRWHAAWPKIEDSDLLYVNVVRVTALAERGGAAVFGVDNATSARDRRVQTRLAASCVQKLRREPRPYAHAFAALLDARLAWADRRSADAKRLLEQAANIFDETAMELYAAATRVRVGSFRGSPSLVESSLARLSASAVRDPRRFTQMLVPGFED